MRPATFSFIVLLLPRVSLDFCQMTSVILGRNSEFWDLQRANDLRDAFVNRNESKAPGFGNENCRLWGHHIKISIHFNDIFLSFDRKGFRVTKEMNAAIRRSFLLWQVRRSLDI